MKKSYYYFLLLILNISFSYAQDIVPETFSENQNTQEVSSDVESTITNLGSITTNSPESIATDPFDFYFDKDLNNTDNSVEKETILESDLEPKSFTSQPIFSSEPISSKDLKIPAPKTEISRKSSFLAVSLSSLVPGLGHVYLKDYKLAGGIFGSSALGLGALFNDYTAFSGNYVLQVSWWYGIYAAYRDVRLYNNNFGYSYKMPTDNFKTLSQAPFNLKILKKPEVWGGLLGALTIAGGIVYLQNKLDIQKAQCKISSKDAKLLSAFPIGLSEEVLFRGYLQSTLSETFTPIGGIILSSLAFGAAHIPNAKLFAPEYRMNYYLFSLPLITSFGVYTGWMTYKNRSLQESVALHSWYDFTLFAVERALTPSLMIGKPSFAFSFSF